MQIEQLQHPRPDCPDCHSPVNENDIFCGKCGYPVKGTEEQISEFHYAEGLRQLQLQENQTVTRGGTNSLFVIAAIFLLGGLIYYFVTEDTRAALALLITNLILALIFLGLGLWSREKPVSAFISGLVLYSLIQLLNLLFEPASIFSGIIMKVVIFIYLIKGLMSAFESQKIRRN